MTEYNFDDIKNDLFQIPEGVSPTPGVFVLRYDSRRKVTDIVIYRAPFADGQALYFTFISNINLPSIASLVAEPNEKSTALGRYSHQLPNRERPSIPILTDFQQDEHVERYYISDEILEKLILNFIKETKIFPNSGLALTRICEFLRLLNTDEMEIQRLISVIEPSIR